MKPGLRFSKEALTQLSVCQYLVSQNNYSSQEAIRRGLQQYGFSHISQATVSRLLRRLGVIKVRNARGIKVYTLAQGSSEVYVASTLAEMVTGVEYNQNFILVRTQPACASYVREAIRQCYFTVITGMIASNDVVWITLKQTRYIAGFSQQLTTFLYNQ